MLICLKVFNRNIQKELSFCHKLQFSNQLQPDAVNLLYFKLIIFDQSEILVWNVKGLQEEVAEILGSKCLSLWQTLNSFEYKYCYLILKLEYQ